MGHTTIQGLAGDSSKSGTGPRRGDFQNTIRRVRQCGQKLSAQYKKKSPADFSVGLFEKRQLPTLPPGGAVPSALVSLTSLFGMGRGGSSPRLINHRSMLLERDSRFGLKERFRAISTGRLNTLLCVHLLPINVVVSHDPVRKSHLEDGFALRCFQRLS